MLARYVFPPKSRRRSFLDLFIHEVDQLFACFRFSGQIWGRQVSKGWVDGELVVISDAPEQHSLFPKWDDEEVRRQRRRVETLCTSQPRMEILNKRPKPRTIIAWNKATSLCLNGAWHDWTSPVASGDDVQPIPVYRLRLPAQARRELMTWTRDYDPLFGIYLTYDPLEELAYEEVADPESDLGNRGRELTRTIEACTGKPTYYYLHRFYGRNEEEERKRKCPLCGGNWLRHGEAASSYSNIAEYEFRCDPCRLISVMAVEPNLRLAPIGEPPSSVTKTTLTKGR